MVVLTEHLILSRSRQTSLDHVKHINLWGNDLTDISLFQRLPNVEVVALSVNKISTLKDFEGCCRLTELYLRKNSIRDLSEIQHLQHIKTLRVLWLSDNPCADVLQYRLHVIKSLPFLSKLDDHEVTAEERQNADKISANIQIINSPKLKEQFLNDNKEEFIVHDANKERNRPSWHQPSATRIKENIRAAAMEQSKSEPGTKEEISLSVPQSKHSFHQKLASENVLSAVLLLINDLDMDSLLILKSELEQKIKKR